MITDILKNAHMYSGIGKRIDAALKYLQCTDFSEIEPGKYDIDGSNIYALVGLNETRTMDGGVWEAHRKYIDVQYVVKGVERMGYANLEKMKVSREYDAEGDCLLLKGEGSFIAVSEGAFVIFAPQDAHMPGVCVNGPAQVKKVVVKVAVE